MEEKVSAELATRMAAKMFKSARPNRMSDEPMCAGGRYIRAKGIPSIMQKTDGGYVIAVAKQYGEVDVTEVTTADEAQQALVNAIQAMTFRCDKPNAFEKWVADVEDWLSR